jgi:hypothetical protein
VVTVQTRGFSSSVAQWGVDLVVVSGLHSGRLCVHLPPSKVLRAGAALKVSSGAAVGSEEGYRRQLT